MTLANLVATGQLKAHKPDKKQIQRLLDAARILLKDAAAESVSTNTRFDAAYNALLEASLAALMANGYRPTVGHGHHAVTIQSLPKTIGIEAERIQLLDTLRNKRGRAIYDGSIIDEASVKACREEAARLLGEVDAWIKKNRPELAT